MKNTQDVNEFVISLKHPQENIIQLMRELIKKSSSELVEGIKWNSPSYSLEGNDIITFNFHYKGVISLVFHTGPKGKDTHTKKQLFVDETNHLEWLADKRAVLKISSIEEFEAMEKDIEKIIDIWVEKAKGSFQYQ